MAWAAPRTVNWGVAVWNPAGMAWTRGVAEARGRAGPARRPARAAPALLFATGRRAGLELFVLFAFFMASRPS